MPTGQGQMVSGVSLTQESFLMKRLHCGEGGSGGCVAAAMQLSTNRKIERGSDELPSGQWAGDWIQLQLCEVSFASYEPISVVLCTSGHRFVRYLTIVSGSMCWQGEADPCSDPSG